MREARRDVITRAERTTANGDEGVVGTNVRVGQSRRMKRTQRHAAAPTRLDGTVGPNVRAYV